MSLFFLFYFRFYSRILGFIHTCDLAICHQLKWLISWIGILYIGCRVDNCVRGAYLCDRTRCRPQGSYVCTQAGSPAGSALPGQWETPTSTILIFLMYFNFFFLLPWKQLINKCSIYIYIYITKHKPLRWVQFIYIYWRLK